ncbi:GntR family transcriptional regulator [Neobacillus dielmonensis]|uniref:GntR family transcriptional regulator n=1 Tax=Neobacillus dielmonensis TaxID=1347369 RepID=UPI0005AA5CCD|nr:GntR family transcriptional regulator [Neobacillus dielmonensis]
MDPYAIEKSMPYYDQIYYKLREMILYMKIKPGERVYESRLAGLFNTSRSPVREAVKALIKEGLLVSDEKSRIFVFEPTLDDIVQIYQCRMALESLAAKLTTETATNDQLEEIGEIIEKTERFLVDEEHNRERLIELNTEFHESIILYNNNQLLKKQLRDINSLSYYFRVLNFTGKNRGKELYEEHKHIYQYMKNRESKRAAAAMMMHIENDITHFLETNTTL